jgi:hypothetical protein
MRQLCKLMAMQLGIAFFLGIVECCGAWGLGGGFGVGAAGLARLG